MTDKWTFDLDATLISTTFGLELLLALAMCVCGNIGAITVVKHMKKQLD